MLAKDCEHWLGRGAEALSAAVRQQLPDNPPNILQLQQIDEGHATPPAKNFLPRWADCGGKTEALHACLKLTKFKDMSTRKLLLHRKSCRKREHAEN